MDLDLTEHLLAIAVSITVLVTAVTGAWWKWQRPRRQRAEERGQKVDAMHEVMLGRPEVLDNSGAVAQHAQPGIPARMDQLNTKVDALQNDIHGRVSHLEVVTVSLADQVKTLRDAVQGCPAHGPTPTVSTSVSIGTTPPEES